MGRQETDERRRPSTPESPGANDLIRRRYRWLAPIYPLFEYAFWLPWGIRKRAVRRMGLQPGDRALEVGCGTGRNFPHIMRAIGPAGRLYGVDLTPEMLARARARCAARGWANVTLVESDAAAFDLPEPVDAALFSLCYSVIPDHLGALRMAWRHLRPGGRLVIMDAKEAPGLFGPVVRFLGEVTSRLTVLGSFEKRAWEDVRALTDQVDVEEVTGGAYFICTATKAELLSLTP